MRQRSEVCGHVAGRAGVACVLAFLLIAGCTTAPQRDRSVNPGINDSYEDADVDAFVERFETESREIYAQRREIVMDVGARPGAAIADIGAGTGFFTMMFAERVGPDGRVYAVDITPEFVAHIESQAADRGLEQVQAVVCEPDSVNLPPGSVDLAFICDTYHHFEYSRSTMRSLHAALRPGGEVVVIDFERIPGKSREWVLGHVRAGKQEVIDEITSYGFELVREGATHADLEENYVLRFRKR